MRDHARNGISEPRLYGYDPSGISVNADEQCSDGGCREAGRNGAKISSGACYGDDRYHRGR